MSLSPPALLLLVFIMSRVSLLDIDLLSFSFISLVLSPELVVGI